MNLLSKYNCLNKKIGIFYPRTVFFIFIYLFKDLVTYYFIMFTIYSLYNCVYSTLLFTFKLLLFFYYCYFERCHIIMIFTYLTLLLPHAKHRRLIHTETWSVPHVAWINTNIWALPSSQVKIRPPDSFPHHISLPKTVSERTLRFLALASHKYCKQWSEELCRRTVGQYIKV